MDNVSENQEKDQHKKQSNDNEEAAAAKSHANVVAAHYNHLEEKGLSERFNSPIFYLRNFNNWVKSVLIQEYTDKIREKDYGRTIRVLDICCGKGGDLSKWKKARVGHVIFADIAEVSIEQCETRYNDIRERIGRLFTAEFIAADCTRVNLRDKYRDPSIKFDIASCQFGLHYSFESLGQARRMLANISDCLKPGAFFFGTLPDANEIIKRSKKSENGKFGNRIYNIELLFDPNEKHYPLFGGKYDFHLEGVVDCPEFLVYFELFAKLAKECGLELVYRANFGDFYIEYSDKYRDLLHRIKCLEMYPGTKDRVLIGDEKDYDHAKDYCDKLDCKNDIIYTMSQSEWEVATLYLAFAFKKCPSTYDSNGKLIYIYSDKKLPTSQK